MTAATNGQRSPGSSGTCDAAPRQFNGWTDPGIDDIIADPNLTASAKLVIIALVRRWAWFKDHCFPSDQTIAAAIGMSPGHVQRCLAELEQAGYVRRERTPRRRIIWLLWRCDQPITQATPTPTIPVVQPTSTTSRPVAQSPTAPVRAARSHLSSSARSPAPRRRAANSLFLNLMKEHGTLTATKRVLLSPQSQMQPRTATIHLWSRPRRFCRLCPQVWAPKRPPRCGLSSRN